MKPKLRKQHMGADLPLSAVGALASGDGAVGAGVKAVGAGAQTSIA